MLGPRRILQMMSQVETVQFALCNHEGFWAGSKLLPPNHCPTVGQMPPAVTDIF